MDWAALNAEFVANLTGDDVLDLAASLRLPVEAINEIEVGVEWHDETRVYTFPERSGTGEIIGISRRYPDAKRAVPGSRRGLTIPMSLPERSGPVYIVEGATDTIALACCGLAALGRPSNVGGGEHLAELLAGIDRGREVVIVGENDRKPDGKWPGKEGAESVAKALAEKLGRPVRIAFPPESYKDSRDRIADLIADAGEVLDLAAVGREFVATLVFAEGPKSRFEFLDADEFFGADYRPEWIIPRLLVRKQPGIIGGPSKTLKTSLLVDLAISVAAGMPFLGEFRVPHRMRVAVASGESGLHVLQETALRVAKARGVADPSGTLKGWFRVSGTLPTLSDTTQVAEFSAALERVEADLVLVDPLYLCMGDVDEKSMFQMGSVLRSVTDIIQRTGRTIVVAHHSNGRLAVGEPMGLEHLAYAGGQQFARQWLLLNRREKYAGNGLHDLWMSVGGSVGHGGLWSLHVEEGVTGNDFSGRRWDVTVQSQDEIREHQNVEREAEQAEANREKSRRDQTEVLKSIDSEMTKGVAAATKNAIRDRLGWSSSRVSDAIGRLYEDGIIEEIEFEKGVGKGAKRRVNGYRRTVTG